MLTNLTHTFREQTIFGKLITDESATALQFPKQAVGMHSKDSATHQLHNMIRKQVGSDGHIPEPHYASIWKRAVTALSFNGIGAWCSKPSSPPYIPQMLNLGCGHRIHPAWLNLDIAPAHQSVIAHNLTEPLPLDDASCSVAYSSHVLEHLPKDQAPSFLAECYRVLTPGGVVRIVVPDLETIARLYLHNFDAAVGGDLEAEKRHEWMTLELVDQLARHRSGGQMLDYWKQDPMPAENFVYERMGAEARNVTSTLRALGQTVQTAQVDNTATSVGQFRMSGEVHQWMYDRISLSKILRSTGFVDIRPCKAWESRIHEWASYQLDTDESGRTHKPDSLFIEAQKPA